MGHDQTTDKCRRGSLSMAWTVEIACCIGDPGEAAKYLAACGVPFDVAHRVILHPQRRRGLKS